MDFSKKREPSDLSPDERRTTAARAIAPPLGLRSVLAGAATILSLLICIFTVTLWIRSQIFSDWVQVNRIVAVTPDVQTLTLEFSALRSGPMLQLNRLVIYSETASSIDRVGLRDNLGATRGIGPPISAADCDLQTRHGFAWQADVVSRATRRYGRGPNYRNVMFAFAEVEASGTFTRITVPWWLLTLLTAALPAARFYIKPFLAMHRRRPGLCPTCNYDLRATPDRCPECGTSPTNV